jgi:DHA2 family multidrug resistance protein
MPWISGAWNLEDLRGLTGLSREMARQAAMIGYLDAFVFFIATSLVVLPLVFLIRVKRLIPLQLRLDARFSARLMAA